MKKYILLSLFLIPTIAIGNNIQDHENDESRITIIRPDGSTHTGRQLSAQGATKACNKIGFTITNNLLSETKSSGSPKDISEMANYFSRECVTGFVIGRQTDGNGDLELNSYMLSAAQRLYASSNGNPSESDKALVTAFGLAVRAGYQLYKDPDFSKNLK
ncbi:hypothetical protein [Edwardsiella tarda]|uniref:hypothetical protein n=1 Tax=Edwardsiella tarda TaxID=636 RepID=UPI00351C0B75